MPSFIQSCQSQINLVKNELRIMLWTNGNEFEAYGWWYAHPLILLVVKFHPKWPYSNQFGLTFRWRTVHPRGTSLSSIHVILMSSRTGTKFLVCFWDKIFIFRKNGEIFIFSSVFLSFFLSFNLTSIPGPERSIWWQLHSWLEQNTPVV